MFILASILATLVTQVLGHIGISVSCAALAALGWPVIIGLLIGLIAIG